MSLGSLPNFPLETGVCEAASPRLCLVKGSLKDKDRV